MITSCNKIKTELNNIKRNTENLPKIMKTDKQKRDYIKSEKGNATNHLNNVKDLHRKEIREINKARELNDKKNLITDIAVKQRFTLQKEYNDLKIRTSQLKSEHDETKKIIDSKNKSRMDLSKLIDDLENENISINEDIYELEQDKKTM